MILGTDLSVPHTHVRFLLSLGLSPQFLNFTHDDAYFVSSLQLLNQLESSGAPPAPADKIDALPVVSVSQEQVGKY